MIILLLTISACNNKIVLYQQEFAASEILGSGNHFGPRQKPRTRLFTEPFSSSDHPKQWLGSYYITNNLSRPETLLNMSLEEDMPIIDSINFKYYCSFSFLNVLDKDEGFKTDSIYRRFRAIFINAKSIKDKRKILYKEDFSIYREALESSRYSTLRPSITINAHSEFQRELKLAAKSQILNQAGYVESKLIGPHIETNFDQLVDVKGAVYQEMSLNLEYIKIASQILKNCDKKKSEIQSKYNDISSEEVIIFLNTPNAAIISGISFIEAKFDYQKIRKLYGGVNDSSATNNVNFHKHRDLTITTASTSFSLRFVRDRKLEIGRRPLYMLFRKKVK